MLQKGHFFLFYLYKCLNKTGLCFYAARNTRHVYCIVSWGSPWVKEGRGQGDLVSQAGVSWARSCAAKQEEVEGLGEELWCGKDWKLWHQGFPAHQVPRQSFTTGETAAEDLGKE